MTDPVLDSLRAALAASPDNRDLRVALARVYLERHRPADAEEVARHGLRAAPTDSALTLVLAECFYAQGRYAECLVLCEQAQQGPAPDPRLWLWTARCHFQGEDHERARASYREALRRDPSLHDDRLAHFAPEETASSEGTPEHVHAQGDPDADYVPLAERAKVRFTDVGGMEHVKEEIRMKVLHPLQHADLFAAYGKKIGGGILMYGPPGCGKTHLARATAGEVDVPFFSIAISDILHPHLGQSERNLRDVFAEARRRAPAVLFFDEVDALAASRRDLQQSASRQVINQFLLELGGDRANNDGLLIIGATNAPWYLDAAFRRPGRFDRILFVPPPDEPARAAILRVLLRGKPAADVDVEAVAKKTREFSGADLGHVVDRAVEACLTIALKRGRPEPLATKDLLKAAKTVRPTTKEWFTQARNHALYANESGLYDDVLEWLGLKK